MSPKVTWWCLPTAAATFEDRDDQSSRPIQACASVAWISPFRFVKTGRCETVDRFERYRPRDEALNRLASRF